MNGVSSNEACTQSLHMLDIPARELKINYSKTSRLTYWLCAGLFGLNGDVLLRGSRGAARPARAASPDVPAEAIVGLGVTAPDFPRRPRRGMYHQPILT